MSTFKFTEEMRDALTPILPEIAQPAAGRFHDPETENRFQLERRADEAGLTAAQREVFIEETERDPVTGFFKEDDLEITLERAVEWRNETDAHEASYVAVGILNLEGMNEILGWDATDVIIRAQAHLSLVHLQSLTNVDVVPFRQGGGWVCFLVLGADAIETEKAMHRAAADVQRYVNATGLDTLPSFEAPEDELQQGTRIVFGCADITPDSSTHDFVVWAERRAYAAMEGARPDVHGETIALKGYLN